MHRAMGKKVLLTYSFFLDALKEIEERRPAADSGAAPPGCRALSVNHIIAQKPAPAKGI